MTIQKFTVHLEQPFSLKLTVESHGWFQLAPWKWNNNCLERKVRVEGAREWISVHQPSSTHLYIKTSSSNESAARQLVTRWLQLDWDPSEFLKLCEINDHAVGDFVRSGGGRFLRGDTFFEDLIKTICTINTTWRQTKRLVASMVALENGVFPDPQQIKKIGAEQLAKECKLGFRARTITSVAAQLLDDQVIHHDGSASSSSIDYDYLISLKGIGPYSAAHSMMLLRDFSTLPVDSEVSAYLRDCGLDANDAQHAFDHWSEYRFLGYKLKRIIMQKNWIGD